MSINYISQKLISQLGDSINICSQMTDELYLGCQDLEIEEDVWISELRADYYERVL